MAAFSSLAIAGAIGAGVAGVLASRGKKKEETVATTARARTNTNPAPTAKPQIGGGGDQGARERPPDAPVIGTAVPRNPMAGNDATSTSATGAGQPNPPGAAPDAGQAAGMAAATKARKAGAGASVLTGLPVNKGSRARLRPKSLIGY